MPIRPEFRDLYPPNWREISDHVRFVRADGRCEECGRPNDAIVECLPDGRWLDVTNGRWRDGQGRQAPGPDLFDLPVRRTTKVVTAAAHLLHDPRLSEADVLRAFCQRCHLNHDRAYHLAMRRLTYLMRRASGDLFLGTYERMQLLGDYPRRPAASASTRRSRAVRRREEAELVEASPVAASFGKKRVVVVAIGGLDVARGHQPGRQVPPRL